MKVLFLANVCGLHKKQWIPVMDAQNQSATRKEMHVTFDL